MPLQCRRSYDPIGNLVEPKVTMHKVKIFKSVESELGALEKEIDEWIESSGANVVSITGNISSPNSAWPGFFGT